MTKKALLFVAACFVVLASVSAYQAQQVASPTSPTSPTSPASPQVPPKPQSAPRAPRAGDGPVEAAVATAPSFALLLNEKSFLGVETENINRENMSRYGLNEPRGVGVVKVLKDSPAERAGLKPNDVILKLDGEPVGSARKLQRLVNEIAPEHNVRLTISRGGAEQELTATLAENSFTMPHVSSLPLLDGAEWRGQFEKALPSIKALPEMQSFTMAFGSNRRIGAATSTLTKQLADYFGVTQGSGLLVSSVTEGSPAAKGGLRAGDVITEVEGNRIENAGDFFRAMNKKKEGDVSLTVVRDKRQLSLRMTPERREGDFDFDFPHDALVAPSAPAAPMTLPRINVTPRVPPAPRARPLIISGSNITI